MNDDPATFPVEEHQRLAAGSRHAAVTINNILARWIDVGSVLDLGCGTGTWLHALAMGGKREIFGVEGEAYPQAELEIDRHHVLTADLGQPIDLQRRFDLVLCLEVAEHIDAAAADIVVANCVRHGDVVLFSAALPGQQGIHHVNEQPPQYWAERFARHGYVALDLIRARIWNDPQIPVWYRQNVLLFAREDAATVIAMRSKAAAEAPAPLLAIAHPELLRWMSDGMQRANARANEAAQQWRALQQESAAALARAQQAWDTAEQARAATATQLAAVMQRHEAEQKLRIAAETVQAELEQAREIEVQARLAAEAAYDEARRQAETATEAWKVAEAAFAAAHTQYVAETEVHRAAEARLAALQTRYSAETGLLASVQADLTRLRQEAASTLTARVVAEARLHRAEATVSELRQHLHAEMASRTTRDASLRDTQETLAFETDGRRRAEARATVLSRELMQARNQVATLSWEKQVIQGSALWRAMQPLRRMGRSIPFGLRVRLRRVIGAAETKDFATAPSAVFSPAPALPAVTSAPAAARDLMAETAPQIAAPPDPRHRGPMRMVFVSGEPAGPGHVYRVERYLEAARSLGIVASCLYLNEVVARGEDIAAAEVMLIWRAANGPEVSHALWVARAHGVKVIFDVDDLMVDPTLATRKVIDGIRTQDLTEGEVATHFQRVREVAVQADACTATTVELARHLRTMDRVTFVMPNLFDQGTLARSRLALRRWATSDDGILRIGYAAGTRTHQRDFKTAVAAVGRILREYPFCRLVLFRDGVNGRAMLEPEEFPALARLGNQIEWRDRVSLADLPDELVRFDINLAPLEVGNPFCESKSELKYFEAALVGVCTIASPTGPMRRAIRDGVTGCLADTEAEWYGALRHLVEDAGARQGMAHAAYLAVLADFGPQEGPIALQAVLQQLLGTEAAAEAFHLDLMRRRTASASAFDIPASSVVFLADKLDQAEVTVIIPLYNYAHYIEEALESVRQQTVDRIDLVVVDDASTDTSLQVATDWAKQHADRFNRILVLRNTHNSGLGRARNTGFDAAETPYVLPLDADNRLRPDCCVRLLDALRDSRAAFAYPLLQCFDAAEHVLGTEPFAPMRFASSNYIDAMALVAKWAWAKVGGYTHIDHGWEDYDFWCKCVEQGLWGEQVREILAEYRVHEASMLRTATDRPDNKRQVIRQLEDRHDWLTIDYRP